MLPAHAILRIARPTDQLSALAAQYCDGLGFVRLGAFADHQGFDGIMLGHPHQPYHLEFTHQRGHKAGRAPTQDHLLVFYLPDPVQWQSACAALLAADFLAVPSYNPYWDQRGRTFEDLDGYRVVLQQDRWPR